jgi:hypothetical protein
MESKKYSYKKKAAEAKIINSQMESKWMAASQQCKHGLLFGEHICKQCIIPLSYPRVSDLLI